MKKRLKKKKARMHTWFISVLNAINTKLGLVVEIQETLNSELEKEEKALKVSRLIEAAKTQKLI